MNPEYALVLGCSGLGLVIAYGFWSSSRRTVFTADLLTIRDELDAAVASRGTSEDQGYKATRAYINGLLRLSPNLLTNLIGVLLMLYWLRQNTGDGAEALLNYLIPTEIRRHEGLLPEVLWARSKVAQRVEKYLLNSPMNRLVALVFFNIHGWAGGFSRLIVLLREELRLFSRPPVKGRPLPQH